MSARLSRYLQAALFRLSEPVARVLADAPAPPRVTAKGVYCVDSRTAAPLLAKNADFRLAPASTLKLMTALLLLRERIIDLNEPIEIIESDCVRGSTMGLRPGDVVSGLDLLYGMLLPSGNDAAQAIARVCGGAMCVREGGCGDSVPRFVQAMNTLAQEMKLDRSRFTNPSGQDSGGQYSTARNVAMLGAAAFAEPLIRQVCSAQRHVVHIAGSASRRIELKSSVGLQGERDFLGGKTGSSMNAGACLVFSARIAGREIVTAILASSVRFGSEVIPESDRRYDDARTILAAIRALRQ